jgi:hypothetical protein
VIIVTGLGREIIAQPVLQNKKALLTTFKDNGWMSLNWDLSVPSIEIKLKMCLSWQSIKI